MTEQSAEYQAEEARRAEYWADRAKLHLAEEHLDRAPSLESSSDADEDGLPQYQPKHRKFWAWYEENGPGTDTAPDTSIGPTLRLTLDGGGATPQVEHDLAEPARRAAAWLHGK